jgi:hypothetical protein
VAPLNGNINQEMQFEAPKISRNIPIEVDGEADHFVSSSSLKQTLEKYGERGFCNQNPSTKKQQALYFTYIGNLVSRRMSK